MALLLFAVLMFAFTGRSCATWCVCKDGLGDAALQKTLDYACGAGADCAPVKQTGACYSPNTVRAHCSYAVNSFFQKKGQAQGTCDFAGSASISTSDPSANGCVYPSSASTSGTSTTPVTTTPSTTTPSTTTPSTTTPTTGTGTTPTTTATPYTATPTGVLGGGGTGMSPTGINTDVSNAGLRRLSSSCWLCFFAALVASSGLMPLWS
ncbi:PLASMODESMATA CALLOSE-BINDING PROTEIN 3-like [Rhodamnia argentea]|uniref:PLASMODESMATA CALLOSE-BINDING PROTEIN 3-like n=1 Tax=Rhodamnia argentea TaxID=178133 RepID=A0A8B8PM04_9MYRT|nr:PLASMODESMATA CALLOSE-BINDING PROTEIN 3-like [Rhodamnia argentea]